jgi:hypothetical protein
MHEFFSQGERKAIHRQAPARLNPLGSRLVPLNAMLRGAFASSVAVYN